jgi:hypothetical protein
MQAGVVSQLNRRTTTEAARIYIRITASQSYPIQFVVNGTLSADGGGDFSEYRIGVSHV